jgi:hypothetical protein
VRDRVPDVLEKGRVRGGPCLTDPGEWYGAFVVRGPQGDRLTLLVSKGDPDDWAACGFDPPAWEHVSVSLKDRCPTWDEMAFVKDLCWGPEECVMQLHPPRSCYVNFHPNCLHLFRPVGVEIPMPPPETVGPKGTA